MNRSNVVSPYPALNQFESVESAPSASRISHRARTAESDIHKHPAYTRDRIRRVTERIHAMLTSDSVMPVALEHAGPVGRITADAGVELDYAPIDPPSFLGMELGPVWSTHWFRVAFVVPEEWAGREVRLDWFSGCEATVWHRDPTISRSCVLQGVNPLQPEAELIKACLGGERIELWIEVACNTLLGNGAAPGHEAPAIQRDGSVPRSRSPYVLERCRIFAVDSLLETIYYDLHVLRSLEADRTPTQSAVSVGGIGYVVRPGLDNTWAGRLLFDLNAFCNAFAADEPETWGDAHRILRGLLACGNASVAHEMTAIGHCHIDTAWLWPLEETHRKCVRSWSAQLRLMDRYPAYRFACSQAYQYAEVKERHPELFEAIQAKARTGQWQVVGGSWIEPDCNLPSGEALIRQFLHGQRFFEEHFGKRCNEFWNPDVFGYNAQLPQIIRHCGIDRFLTQKLSWNRFTVPPHHTFFWRGLDGSEVLTHFPPGDTYNGSAEISQLRYHAANYKDADRGDQAIYLFGHGDGGGGPTPAMLETLTRTNDLLGIPRTEFRTVDGFFDRLIDRTRAIPTVVGEMYFELHRGTYTSQAELKRLNRQGEVALYEAELALVDHRLRMGWVDGSDRRALNEAWKTLLLNQFHDILPGSCIHEVAERAKRDLEEVLVTASDVRAACWQTAEMGASMRNGSERPERFWLNTTGSSRDEIVECDGRLRRVKATAFGLAEAVVPHDAVSAEPDGGGFVLQNTKVRATLSSDGELVSLIHQLSGREALRAPAGVRRFRDHPVLWDAWDVDPFALETPFPLPAVESVELTRDDPLRVEVTVKRSLDHGDTMTQVFRLDAGAPSLRVRHEIQWSQRHALLKFVVPTSIQTDYASCEIPFGVLRRPTHANTQAEVAMFEMPGQRFIDLSDRSFGVTLLCDSKYGYAARHGDLSVSLLRGPTYPDPECDIGTHRFTIALMPHAGEGVDACTLDEAESLTRPLAPLDADRVPEVLKHLNIEGEVIVSAVKLAEDGDAIVVRVYEPLGKQGEVRISLAAPVRMIYRSNGLEDRIEPISQRRSDVELSLRPFEIATVIFEMSPL